MITSAKLQEKIEELLQDNKSHSVQEIKSFLEKEEITDYTEGQFAGSITTMMRNGIIEKQDRGIYILGKGGEKIMKTCFVVSPIGEENSDIRRNADLLFKFIIQPVCKKCGFEPIRVDQVNDSDSITKRIIEYLEKSELVIADITGKNPNVFYEIGYRSCQRKPIIHMKTKGESLPFDITTMRTYDYDLTDLENVEEVKSRLEQTIRALVIPEDTINEAEDLPAERGLSVLLSGMYQIQDAITELKEEIKKKDTETIQAIMQTSLKNAAKEESQDTVLMKTLLPEMIKNPDSFMNFMKIAEKFSGK